MCFASVDAAVAHGIFIAGQVSPSNVVRGPDGTWALVDLASAALTCAAPAVFVPCLCRAWLRVPTYPKAADPWRFSLLAAEWWLGDRCVQRGRSRRRCERWLDPGEPEPGRAAAVRAELAAVDEQERAVKQSDAPLTPPPAQ